MKLLKFIISLVFILSSLNIYIKEAQSAERDLCICQTGSSTNYELVFFKLGCKNWNFTQSCNEKITISIDDSIEKVLTSRPEVKSVKLGYVGHWGSSAQTVKFLDEKVLPSIKKHNVYFDIHNSACLSTSNPYEIRNYFKSIGKYASNLHFFGYQAISTGGWDPALPGKNNFWASINGSSLKVEFPNCNELENKECIKIFQENGTGICYKSNEEKYIFLRCEPRAGKAIRANAFGKGPSKIINHSRYEWVKAIPKLKTMTPLRRYAHLLTYGIEDNTKFDHIIKIDSDEDDKIAYEQNARELKEWVDILKKEDEVNLEKIILKSNDEVEIPNLVFVKDNNKISYRKKDVQDIQEADDFVRRVEIDVRNLLIDEAQRSNFKNK